LRSPLWQSIRLPQRCGVLLFRQGVPRLAEGLNLTETAIDERSPRAIASASDCFWFFLLKRTRAMTEAGITTMRALEQVLSTSSIHVAKMRHHACPCKILQGRYLIISGVFFVLDRISSKQDVLHRLSLLSQ
jgi:hypothetical protein